MMNDIQCGIAHPEGELKGIKLHGDGPGPDADPV